MVVPGIGAALAFAPPGAISVELRAGLVVGLGYGLVAGLAIVLALARVFTRPAFIAGVVLLTAVVWFLALRQTSLRTHASALVSQAREAPFTLAAGLMVIAAVAFTWPLYPPSRNLAPHAPWRYWSDGLEVAAAGRVPATTEQWGAELPMTVSKVVLNAFEGGVSFLIGPDPLPGMRAVLTIAAVGVAAALLGLGRELGLRAFAPLVPTFILLLPGRVPLSDEIVNDLSTYRAENVGRVAAFTALLAAMYAIRVRRRIVAVIAGGLFALAGLTHGVSAVIAITLLVLYALAILLVERRAWRGTVVSAVVVLAVTGAGYLGILGASGGDLGFQRVTSGSGFAGFPSDIDPTRSFNGARVVRLPPTEGHFFVPPREIASRYGAATAGAHSRAELGVAALAALAALTVAVVLVASRFIPLAFVAWGLVVAVVSAALLFSFRYRTQIPGDFGVRRLYDYAAFPPVLIVSAGLEVLALWLTRRRDAVAAVVALAIAAVALVAAVIRIPNPDPRGRAGAGIAVMEHVAEVVPCGARMLPNARSAGAWEAMTGRRSVLEGLAPYLRPEVMQQVLPRLIGARQFFANPRTNRAFLARERIDYIVVVTSGVWIGSQHPYPANVAAIESLPDVDEISSARGVTIFAVGSGLEPNGAPQPRRCPI